ncbi:MAG: hypothetical protein R8G34_13720 [Paracoccaceae bacterium]|nr:hypothetical protein [Paracoccaceae bacterium]
MPTIINGTSGDDTLLSTSADETILGGAGTDLYFFEQGFGSDVIVEDDDPLSPDRIHFGAGILPNDITFFRDPAIAQDLIIQIGPNQIRIENHFMAASPSSPALPQIAKITFEESAQEIGLLANGVIIWPGAATSDALFGTEFKDFIAGGAGDDLIVGRGDDDTLLGDAGEDLIRAGSGNDHVAGGDDNDTIFGGDGDDTILGGSGDDEIAGNNGADHLEGNDGNDILRGGPGGDFLNGGDGSDTVYGGSGNDTLIGGAGQDLLDGGSGDDSVLGGAGNDILAGGTGADTLEGGIGADTLRGGGGNDLMYGDAGADLMFGASGEDILFGGDGDDVMEGNQQADLLFGEAGNDRLRGGDGFDMLDGGAGNDILVGENGNDALNGGAGQDILRGLANNDTFIFSTVAESAFGFADLIDGIDGVGAQGGDIIDLSAIDADETVGGLQAFNFLGQATTAQGIAAGAGTLWVEDVGSQTRIFGNVDGNASVDFAIRVNDGAGISAADYAVDDFVFSTLSISDAIAPEGSDLEFTVTLDKLAKTDINLNYEVLLPAIPGAGQAGSEDIEQSTALIGSVKISEGDSVAAISISAATDLLIEGDETFEIRLVNPRGGTQLGDHTGIGTILDAPLPPQISISDARVLEGGDLVFTVSLDRTDLEQVGADYQVLFGSANASDLQGGASLSGSVTIDPGTTSVEIVLPTIDDTLFECDEAFRVVLSNPSANAVLADSTGRGVIMDDETGICTIWRNGGQVTIGSAVSPASFSIGAFGTAPGNNSWIDAGPTGNWSDPANWSLGAPPSVSDTVLFGTAGSGDRSFVDANYVISALRYTGQADQTIDFANGNELEITNDVLLLANGSSPHMLGVENGTHVVANAPIRVGINASGSGTASGVLKLTTGASLDAAMASELSIGVATFVNAQSGWAAEGRLALGANTSLTLGAAGAPAGLYVGVAGNTGFGGATGTGVLDASERSAVLDWTLSEILIGSSASGGTATGTLIWDQSETLAADTITFGNGRGQGILEVPTGGELNLEADILRLAYNNSGAGTGMADIDFATQTTDATLTVASELSIGVATFVNAQSGWAAEGRLALGANTSLTLGAAGAPAGLYVGVAGNTGFGGATGTGVLDASERSAVLDWTLSEILIGSSASGGTATGTLIWDQSETLAADTITFGNGRGQGILEVPTGGELNLEADILRLAYNNSGAGTGMADIDFATQTTDATLTVASELSIGVATFVNAQSGWAAEGRLALGANTSLTLGAAGAPAGLYVGVAGNTGFGGATGTGILDASERSAVLDWTLSEILIGSSASGGTATGTLIWDQSETLAADTITFGNGRGQGILEVPTGGELNLEADILRLAYNNSGAGTGMADIDFATQTTDATLTVASELSIGVATFVNAQSGWAAEGRLALGANTSLTLGAAGAPAGLYVGVAGNTGFGGATGTGILDASEGSLTADLTTLNIGTAASSSVAQGTFFIGLGVDISVVTATVGTLVRGEGIIDFGEGEIIIGDTGTVHFETLNFAGGKITGDALVIDATSGTFNFTGGTLSVNSFTGDLNQTGGVLDSGVDVGEMAIFGNYSVSSAGSILITVANGASGLEADSISVQGGGVNLNSDFGTGASLDLSLTAGLGIGESLLILENDGVDAIVGTFENLAQDETIESEFDGDLYRFQIDYFSGDGNDIGLTLYDIA